jgi:uncharacterized protein (TIGR02145 family)
MKSLTILCGLISVIMLIDISCKKEKTVPEVLVFNPNLIYGSLTDQEGNTYKTIKIGNQTWMAENLITSKYRNGDVIGTTSSESLDITGESSPKYQWIYGGDEINLKSYGRLYTWYAVTDTRNVCPTGWHIPSDVEWTTLTDYLTNEGYGFGGSGSDIGKSMAAKSGWTIDNTEGNVGNNQAANDSSGFTALPGGYRFSNGTFSSLGYSGYWWSSTVGYVPNAWSRNIRYSFSDVGSYLGAGPFGFSVRCTQDL